MASRHFSGRVASDSGPATRFAPVTPTDDAPLPKGPCRSLYVGAGGALRLADSEGTVIVIQSGAGQYHPLRAAQVFATGTTASGIVALY